MGVTLKSFMMQTTLFGEVLPSERKYYIYKAPTNLFQRFVEAYAAENNGKGKTKEAIVKEFQVSSRTCVHVYINIHIKDVL